MSVGLSRLVEHVIRLTQHRDRDRLNAALIEALMELLAPQAVTLVLAVSEVDQHCWLPWLHRERGGELQTLADPLWVQMAQLQPLQAVPQRQHCLESRQLVEVVSEAGCRILVPLFEDPREQGQGVIEIRSAQRPGAVELDVLSQLMSVYRNMQGMLDYSECDALTGLLNRKSFDDVFFKMLRDGSAEASVLPVTSMERRHEAASYWLAMLDVDHFKRVNDVHGHAIGDEVLLLVARLLRGTLRSLDRVFRFGGEEFVVLLRCADDVGALGALERVRGRMAQQAFPQVGSITVSVGLTTLRPGDSPSAARERADQAVYYAKEHGRNQVRSYEQLVARGVLQTDSRTGGVELF
jgi:diguanylate cyclase (GGDEF)-like protein